MSPVYWELIIYIIQIRHFIKQMFIYLGVFVCLFVCLMVFNATFTNISAISWRSSIMVKETGGSEKTTDLSQITDKLYHIMLYTSPRSRSELTTTVMIDTDDHDHKGLH